MFPFYLIHQTIIVVVDVLRCSRLGLPGWARVRDAWSPRRSLGCIAFYLVGRRIALLRPLIGLRLPPRVRLHRENDTHDWTL